MTWQEICRTCGSVCSCPHPGEMERIDSIVSHTNKRLWFLKRLKRSRIPQHNIVYYYEAVIRPVVEYSSTRLAYKPHTADHTKTLEAVQQWACQIIVGCCIYTDNFELFGLETLAQRRLTESRNQFQQVTNNSNHHSITSKARQRYH